MDKQTGALARLRGALVGSVSGSVGIAAHSVNSMGMAPTQSSVMLLLTVCAAFGALVASVRVQRFRVGALVAALGLGQAIGHVTLTVGADHHHGMNLTPAMYAGHAVAIAISAFLILSAERAYALAVSTLRRVLPVLFTQRCADTSAPAAIPEYRAKVARWLLVSAGTGTRGPPVFV